MAFSINRATILGNLTRDPELRYTPGGTAVVKVGIATNHSYKKDDEWVDSPSFHNVVVWGKMAEFIAQTYKKGDKMYVDGRINYGKYTNKNGQDVYFTEIIADNAVGMTSDGKPAKSSKGVNSGVEVSEDENVPDEPQDGGEEVDPDDIPF